MQINSNSQYTYYQSGTSTKQLSEKKIDTFVKYIDESKTIKNEESYYSEKSTIKWEDQPFFPGMQVNYISIYDEWEKENSPNSYEWKLHIISATNGNKYDDAPEFEAFVKKWMDKGESEKDAIERASVYSHAGLLEYGKQKAIFMCPLSIEDTKQHGLWLIDNPPFKQAIIQTFNSANLNELADLSNALFTDNNRNNKETNFKDLLKQYGIKLEDLKKKDLELQDSKYTFTGDINLKNDNSSESIEYNNFIFDTLINYFKDSIEKVKTFQEREDYKEDDLELNKVVDSLNSIIDNFKITIDEYNEKKN